MGVFHFPRINVKGLLQINVATANNDDYSGEQFPQGSPYAGQPLRLNDSVNVQPLTYGMTDEEWNKWAITPLQVYNPPRGAAPLNKSEGFVANASVLPGEWNFFGDMGMTMMNVKVTGITDPYNNVPASLKNSLNSAVLSFNNRADSTGRSTALLIDVNQEDSNSSQIFSDFISLASHEQFILSGKPTKGMLRWINFQRNNNLTGPNGAAGTFQMSIPLSELQGQPIIEALPASSPEGAKLAGIVCRFTLYRPMQVINVFKYPNSSAWLEQMISLYATQGLNPDYAEIQATISPWFEGEPASSPAGKLLIPTNNTIPVPKGCKGNGPQFSLCPAMAYINWSQGMISIDFSATFPDQYQGSYDPLQTGDDPKWNFGDLSLGIVINGEEIKLADINYSATAANDNLGWVIDFPFNTAIPDLENKLQVGSLTVTSPTYGTLLAEQSYFIISDTSGLYAEQGPTGSTSNQFRNEDAGTVPASFTIYKNGTPLTASDPERLTLYYYDTTPNQQPGNSIKLVDNYQSGQAITIPVDAPGNRLITGAITTATQPPASYGDFNSTVMPIINIRILPYKDYSQYYIDPSDPQPVGNDQLTFDVIYNEVFRNYYLLYPAMSQRIPLNDPEQWSDAEMAGRLMQRISLDFWGRSEAMPRSRDLSQCRRTLLTAWCLKYFQT